MICVVYSFLVAIIITGNGLILTSFFINRKLRTVTNTLIMSLSGSDMLVGLISIPCWMYIFLSQYNEQLYSEEAYQFYITFDIFIGSASILQLTAISIERCYAIVKPLRHRTLSMKVFYMMIAIPWLYAAVAASLQPVQFERWKEIYTVLMTTTCFFIPFLVILVAYVTIFIYARSGHQRHIVRHRRQKNAYRYELRLSSTVALITVLFVIAWLPLFVVSVIATYYPDDLPSPLGTDRLLKFVKFCHYSNSAINPFVYAYRNSEMTRTFRHLGYKILCKKHVRDSVMSPVSSFTTSYNRSTNRSFRRTEKDPKGKKAKVEVIMSTV